MSSGTEFGVSGALLTCDVATACVIRRMNELPGGNFILQELDDTHILIQADMIDFVRESVAAFLDENVWTKE
jgi:hypothetical protein